MFSSLGYLWALMRANMQFYKAEMKRLFVMSSFMVIQNSMFFALWIILFQSIDNLKGWNLTDMARMYGIVASAIGISLFFFNGARTIAYRIQEGSLDSLIARPRAVLPALLMSSTSTASLGDILYGPLLWTVMGAVSLADVPLLLALTLLASIIFTSMTVIIFSLAFWFKSDTRFTEQLFITLIIGSCSIIHGQPLIVRLVLMTVLPGWFISYIPTQLVRHFDPMVFTGLCFVAVFYAGLATLVFRAGMRRYVSSLT